MFRLFGLLLVGLVLAGCQTNSRTTFGPEINGYSDKFVCSQIRASISLGHKKIVDEFNQEAKRRGLRCGESEASTSQVASAENASKSTALVPSQNNPTEFVYYKIRGIQPDDITVCREATFKSATSVRWQRTEIGRPWAAEAKRRGLSCGVGVGAASGTQMASSNTDKSGDVQQMPSATICKKATLPSTRHITWESEDGQLGIYVREAKRRGLSCGVGEEASGTRIAPVPWLEGKSDSVICSKATYRYGAWRPAYNSYVQEAERRGLGCDVDRTYTPLRNLTTTQICRWATLDGNWNFSSNYETLKFIFEANRRGLNCGLGETPSIQKIIEADAAMQEESLAQSTQTASSTTTPSNTPSSAELTAAQKEAERLRQELATLKAQQEQQQQTISNDTQIPRITISSADTKGKQGVIRGKASDNVGVAEVTIDGNAVAVQSNGSFEYSTFVPATGLTVTVQATDMAGISSKQTVSLQRNVNLASASISFDRLNPIGKPALKNKDAIALIIGIGSYENIIDAAYADKDALMFRDYAAEKLGIPESRIKTLINEDAEIGEVLLGIRKWIRRSTKPDKTDVYVFYAGHGIATASGEAYILPYDGRPEVDLLDRTALLQKELFAEIDKAKPRNVTIFLDACYTGKARTGEVLMADANYRPIAIRPIDDGMPDNFTLITASSGDEFSGPLEEAKHGLFSYFLMKGMEGDADSNQDKKITAGELHKFVKENVLRQSADKQTPELQGNADRVLVTFK